MKKLNPMYFMLFVLVLVGTVLIGRSVYRIYSRQPLITQEKAELNPALEKVRELDLKNLEDKNKDPNEIAKSLKRLLQQGGIADMSEQVHKYIDHEDVKVRAAALQVVAAQNLVEFEPKLREGLDSDSSEIRRGVIAGLGQRPDDFSRNLLQQTWQKDPKDAKERLDILLNLKRVSNTNESKEEWNQIILAELKKQSPWDAPLQWVDVFKSFPRNDVVLQKAWSIVSEAKPMDLSFRALLYLRDFAGPESLKSDLKKAKVVNHSHYQLALIDLIFEHCPKGWDALEKEISTSTDPQVKEGLENAELSVKCL